MRIFLKKHPRMTVLGMIAIISLALILVLGRQLLPRGTEDVLVVNEYGALERQTLEYKEERVEDYTKQYGASDGIAMETDFQMAFEANGFETTRHFYNLTEDETGEMSHIRDEGFRFLKNENQEVFLAFSREGIPLRSRKNSMMHAKLSRINQVPMTVMGGISAAKEERYQVFIQDYKGIYAYIRTVHITEDELVMILYEITDGLS